MEAERDGGSAISLSRALAPSGGVRGALVDPALIERLDLREGSLLSVGGIELEVRGTIVREPDRAGSGGPFGFWPRIMIGLDALAESGLIREGSLVYHQYALRLTEGNGPIEWWRSSTPGSPAQDGRCAPTKTPPPASSRWWNA